MFTHSPLSLYRYSLTFLSLCSNSQSKDLGVLCIVLRIVFDLFSTLKKHLKVQLEVFFTSVHLRIGESPSSSFEQKELVLESLVEFCHEPLLIVGLHRRAHTYAHTHTHVHTDTHPCSCLSLYVLAFRFLLLSLCTHTHTHPSLSLSHAHVSSVSSSMHADG